MSYSYNDYIDCPAVQERLTDQFLNNPQMAQWPNGLLRLVTSDVNTNGTLQRTISRDGKLKVVELTYQPRFTDESSNSAVINCEGGNEYGDTSTTYNIDPTVGKSRSWQITPSRLIRRCESNRAWFADQLQKHMNAIEHDIDIELAQYVAANLGHFYDSTDTEMDTNTRTTTNAYNTDLIGDVAYEFERIQWMTGQPFLIGDGDLNKYVRAVAAGCCALQGVDLGEFAMQNPTPFLRDPEVPTALGDPNSFVVMGRGAVQMLSYLEFEEEMMQFNNELLIQGVVVNPYSGIAYDYLAKYDCGLWKFQIKIAYIFATIPQDSYRTDDPLEGTNGILKFNIVNPA